MQLLITKSKPSGFFKLENNQITQLVFPNFHEHDLCQPKITCRLHLPWEICSKILGYLFEIYLKTFNFDLASDLLFVKKDLIYLIYKSVYGDSQVHWTEKYRRLSNTLYILAEIHDTYLSVIQRQPYSVFKLVRTGDPHLEAYLNPWDFTFDFFIEPSIGVIAYAEERVEVHSVGPLYGNQVWASGSWRNGIFNCFKLSTPIINLKFVNIYDVLQLSGQRISSNRNFASFFELIRKVYGPYSAVHVMIQPADEINPFISDSDEFIRF